MMSMFLADFIGHPKRRDFVEVFWIQIWIHTDKKENQIFLI
jgi:hypothetical protein